MFVRKIGVRPDELPTDEELARQAHEKELAELHARAVAENPLNKDGNYALDKRGKFVRLPTVPGYVE